MSDASSPMSETRVSNLGSSGYAHETAAHFASNACEALDMTGVTAGQPVDDITGGPGALASRAQVGGAWVCALDFAPRLLEPRRSRAAAQGSADIELPHHGLGDASPRSAQDAFQHLAAKGNLGRSPATLVAHFGIGAKP